MLVQTMKFQIALEKDRNEQLQPNHLATGPSLGRNTTIFGSQGKRTQPKGH